MRSWRRGYQEAHGFRAAVRDFGSCLCPRDAHPRNGHFGPGPSLVDEDEPLDQLLVLPATVENRKSPANYVGSGSDPNFNADRHAILAPVIPAYEKGPARMADPSSISCKSSVTRSRRGAPVKPIVEASLDGVLVIAEADGGNNTSGAGEESVAGAEVVVLVFDLA